MTRKKNKKKVRPTGKFKEFIQSKEFAKLLGACMILLSTFIAISMVSFFFAWPHPQTNWLGVAGNWTASHIIQDLFGFASFGLCFLLFLYGIRMFGKEPLPLSKTTLITIFWTLWLSTFLGYIAGAWVKNGAFANFAGNTGYFIASGLHKLLRWGTIVLLLFIAGAVLYLVHHVRFRIPKVKLSNFEMPKINLPEIHMPKVDAKQVEEEVTKVIEDKDVNKPKEEQRPPIIDLSTLKSRFAPKDKPQEAPKPEATEKTAEPEEQSFEIDDLFERVNQRAQRANEPETPATEPTFTIEPAIGVEVESNSSSQQNAPDEEIYTETEAVEKHYGIDDLYDPHLDLKGFVMPDTNILQDWEVKNTTVTKEELIENKDRIVETLQNYGINIVEITAAPGPTVTLYEMKPAPGVRISKIKGLEDDIALSLSALGIRIIAPIPGKGTVGIEVPNAKPQIVSMKTMLDSTVFRNSNKMELPIALGKTISNEPYVTDLAKMPHLLMAGATGTGKSVGLNAVITSLLYRKHPSELKFVMVDPKKVELSLYSKIERHYLAKLPDSDEAIITDVKKVVRTLNSLCIEMDQRYDLLKQAQVRKITEYNDKFIHRHLNPLTEVTPGNNHRYLPYIVVVIDEFADLIMTAGKEVEMPICRLAQLARAVGIHLIIATQRPTTNIITGTIKANFPARIAFKVTSGIDSRTILDTSGAQRLIGRGDMLISLSGADMIRLQCALIETEEIDKLADFIGQQRGYPEGFLLPEYLDENEEPNKEFDPKQKDEFFNDAARLVVSSQFGSTSLLQRKLQLGYNRAGRIIDQLEAAGIVGPYNGSKAREVLIHDEATLDELLRSL